VRLVALLAGHHLVDCRAANAAFAKFGVEVAFNLVPLPRQAVVYNFAIANPNVQVFTKYFNAYMLVNMI
jgi:hypothetical protein